MKKKIFSILFFCFALISVFALVGCGKSIPEKTYAISYLQTINEEVDNSANPEYFSNKKALVLKNPLCPGYVFDGWYLEETVSYEGSQYNFNYATKIQRIRKGTNHDLKLFGKWHKDTFAVNFESDGGTTLSSLSFEYKEEVDTSSFESPVKQGYDFAGWTFSPEFAEGSTMPASNVVATASWSKQYDVNFVLDTDKTSYYVVNSATDTDWTRQNPSYANGLAYSDVSNIVLKTDATTSRPGYGLEGWYLEDTFETKISTINISTVGQATKNLTLYAKWEKLFDVDLSAGKIIKINDLGNTKEKIVVPAIIDGVPMTSVGRNYGSSGYNFMPEKYATNVKEVIIEEGITEICNKCFYKCYALNSIRLPSTITSIGTSAFEDCQRLEGVDVVLSNSLIKLGDLALARASFNCVTIDFEYSLIENNVATFQATIVQTIVINTKSVYDRASSESGASYLISPIASTIKVLATIDDGSNEYLCDTASYMRVVDGDYVVYTRVAK